MSPGEWAKRVDLAAAYRLVHLYGMDEMIANHISTRVPGEDDAFLINPYGMLYEQMHASCFVKLDLDGNILFNPNSTLSWPDSSAPNGSDQQFPGRFGCVTLSHRTNYLNLKAVCKLSDRTSSSD